LGRNGLADFTTLFLLPIGPQAHPARRPCCPKRLTSHDPNDHPARNRRPCITVVIVAESPDSAPARQPMAGVAICGFMAGGRFRGRGGRGRCTSLGAWSSPSTRVYVRERKREFTGARCEQPFRRPETSGLRRNRYTMSCRVRSVPAQHSQASPRWARRGLA